LLFGGDSIRFYDTGFCAELAAPKKLITKESLLNICGSYHNYFLAQYDGLKRLDKEVRKNITLR